MPAEDNSIRPFEVGFPEADLAELRRRVKATRWPERETVADDSQGARPARRVLADPLAEPEIGEAGASPDYSFAASARLHRNEYPLLMCARSALV